MKRWLIGAIVTAVLAAGLWLWGSPYLTLSALHKAADAGNMAAISAKVDYPAVRAGLKDQLRARLAEKDETGLGALGAALAERFADPVVDAAVTPEGMRSIFASAALAEAAKPGIGQARARDMRMHRESLGRFVLTPKHGDGPALVFELQGLEWRVTKVRLPAHRLL